ncbi:MAG: DUF1552 domain-containing protein [Myxococcota bacterium]
MKTTMRGSAFLQSLSSHAGPSRRTFLRSAAAGAAVPFLPSLVTSAQAQDHSYDRFLFIVWAHGVDPVSWQPTTPGATDVGERIRSTSMRDVTHSVYENGSFDGLADKITMLRGVGMVSAFGHTTSVLTGSGRNGTRDSDWRSYSPISIDNVLADHIYQAPPALDVLRLSLTNNLRYTHSIRDRDFVAALDTETAFARLFADGFPDSSDAPPAPTGPSAEERAARRRLRALDRSLNQYRQLRDGGRLSAPDRQRLEQTIESYSAMRARAEAQVAAFADAPPPMMTTDGCEAFSVSGSDDLGTRAQEQIQLFTQAFACGATRVGYWRLRSDHSDDGAHRAHSSGNRNGSGPYARVMRENVQNIANLLRSFDQVVEGNGKTLLDNTLVVCCSDLATSLHQHNGIDAPFLLAGGLGGKFRMGEYIDYADTEHSMGRTSDHHHYAGPVHNELLISIMRGAGLQPDDWGGGGFGHYRCEGQDGGHCGGDRWVGKYADYVQRVHMSRSPAGTELPYLRV